jgi:hypothetical protein
VPQECPIHDFILMISKDAIFAYSNILANSNILLKNLVKETLLLYAYAYAIAIAICICICICYIYI